MRDLLQRMHTGIGAPGSDYGNMSVGNAAQGSLQRILHRMPPCLALPAKKLAAVIFQPQCDSHRNTSSSGAQLMTSSTPSRKVKGVAYSSMLFCLISAGASICSMLLRQFTA